LVAICRTGRNKSSLFRFFHQRKEQSMTRFLTAAVAASAFALGASAASAQTDDPVCMTASEMEAALIDMYGEYPQPGVTRTSTSMVQLWASPRTGTWTRVKYLVDGTACAIEEGDGFGTGETDAPALIASLSD
jgi:hypothetical protein